jgi:ribosome-associated heat shock protein Hsp15
VIGQSVNLPIRQSANLPMLDDTRIDKWLWAARFFKTRSQATAAVTGGKVVINGDPAKPSKAVKVGDQLRLRIGPAEYRIVVTGIGERRGSAAVAQTLYEELPESVAERQRIAAERRSAGAPSYEEKGRPSKKDRRDLERWRRGD